jgi:hypothetical protein
VTRRCSSLVPGATGVYFQSRSSQEPGIFRVAGLNGKIELALPVLGLKRVGLFAAWFGLAPHGFITLVRDNSVHDIYASEWEVH